MNKTEVSEKYHVDEYSDFNENSELFELTVLTNTILRSEKQNYDFVTLYNQVYNIILHGDSDRLYDRLRMCVAYHLSNGVEYELNRAKGLELLVLMSQAWIDFRNAAIKISDVFFYLNVIMKRRNRNVETIYDMTLTVFQNFLFRNDDFLNQLSNVIIQSIDVDRFVHPCEEAKVCSQMILALSKDDRRYFKIHFEDEYFNEFDRYLNTIVCSKSVIEYVDMVNRVIDLETKRALAFGDKQTADLVFHRTTTRLIESQSWFIIESNTGLWMMMAAKYTKFVNKIYKLLMLLDRGVSILVDALDRYIRNTIYDLPTNMEFVIKLIEFKISMENYLENSFENHNSINKLIYSHLKYLLNLNDEVPKYMSLYIDNLLQKNNADNELNYVISMLKYLENNKRDIFEEQYRHHITRRLLLHQKSENNREKFVLNKLIDTFGTKRTKKLQFLFEDLVTSDKLISNFNSSQSNSIDFGIQMLNSHIWPLPKNPIKCSLPLSMYTLVKKFNTFYTGIYGTGRKLILMPQLSTAEVNVVCNLHTFYMTLPMYQIAVLLLFNIHTQISFEKISNITKIPEPELKKTLIILMNNRMLLKVPNNRVLKSNDTFNVNLNYQHYWLPWSCKANYDETI